MYTTMYKEYTRNNKTINAFDYAAQRGRGPHLSSPLYPLWGGDLE